MKITKYEHACLVIEEQGKRLVIDPGSYTKSLSHGIDSVIAIVITHIHADHFDPRLIGKLMSTNKDAVIFCPEEVASRLRFNNVRHVTGGDEVSVDPFRLQFFGGKHAMVHPSYPIAQNVGVMVNAKLYYPGDSFTLPTIIPPVLAIPAHAPWLKMAETVDFLHKAKARVVFPTHNVFLSDAGNELVNHMLSEVIQSAGGQFRVLTPGETLDA